MCNCEEDAKMIRDMQIKDFDNGMFGITATVEKNNGKNQYFMGTYIAYDGLDRNRWIEFFKKEVRKYATDRKYDRCTLIFVERNTDF